jgi:hypothetical protein
MDPTNPTPEQIANVTEAIKAALWLGVALAIYAYLSHRTEDNGPTRWQRWRDWLVEHYLTSSSDGAPAGSAGGSEPVHVPVPDTSTAAGTSAGAPASTDRDLPDIDAAEAGTEGWAPPRLSLHLSDAETIALLALQRDKSGKYRHSANKIYALVGGSRKAVLDQIGAVRDGALAVFRPLNAEQQQLREQLQLDQR